jgi:sterol desaturase/sphingolipid hydroxylase (fatty acid hydroxylase superfamily)
MMLLRAFILLGIALLCVEASPILKKFKVHQVPSVVHHVVATVQDVSAPTMTTGVLSVDGRFCTVTFSAPTNQAGKSVGTNFPCSTLFTFSPGDVSGAVCSWQDDKTLNIYPDLSSAASISQAINVATNVLFTTTNNVYAAGCTATSTNCARGWGSVFIIGPNNPTTPVVSFNTPKFIRNCVPWGLDLRGSSGDGQRGWEKVTVTVAGGSNSAALQTYIQNQFSTTSVITVPTNLLLTDSTYDITVKLCNMFLTCGTGKVTVTVTSTGSSAPVVSISGANSAGVTTSTPLSLTAVASVTGCSGTTSANLKYDWELSSGSSILSSIKSTAKLSNQFSLPASTLSANQNYKVQVTVTDQSSPQKLSSTAAYSFTVQSSPLVASIAPSTMQMVAVGKKLTLNGVGSYDPDDLKSANGAVEYSWSCVGLTLSGDPHSKCELTLGSTTESSLSITTAENAINSVSQITLTVTKGGRSATASIAVNVIVKSAPLITIATTSQAMTQINPSSPLLVSGSISSEFACSCLWSSDSNAVDLTKAALTPVSAQVPASAATVFPLYLAGNSLAVRSSYQFTLKCVDSVAHVIITTNGPPVGGLLSVTSPSGSKVGTEMMDDFQFLTSGWTDPDLPVTYLFGFVNPTTGLISSINTRSTVAFADSLLPAGLSSNAFGVQTLVQAFDVLNAYAQVDSTVTVNQNTNANSAILSQLTASKDSTNLDTVKSLLSVASSVISRVDCSGAPACASLNRAGCKATAGTCGVCLDEFFGQSGDGNSACLAASAVSTTTVKKECPNSCSGQGKCVFNDIASGLEVSTCSIVNGKCAASCACDAGFFGKDCSLTPTKLTESQTLRSTLLTSLASVVDSEDTTADSVSNVVSNIAGIVKTSSDVSASAVTTFSNIAINTLQNSLADSTITAETLSGLLGPADAAIDAHTAQSGAGAGLALGNTVLEAFSAVLNRDSSVGLPAQEFVHNNFRVTQQTVGASVDASLSIPQSDIEKKSGQKASSVSLAPGADADSLTIQLVQYSSSLLDNKDTTKYSNIMSAQFTGGSTVVVKLANVAGNLGPPKPEKALNFTTECETDDKNKYTYTCPDSKIVLSHTCRGVKGTMNSFCPVLETACAGVDIAGSSNDYKCTRQSIDLEYITCKCTYSPSNGRRLDATKQTGIMNMVAMTQFIGNEAAQTFKAAPAMTDPKNIEKSLIVIVMYVVLWLGGILMIAGCIYRQRKMKKLRLERKLEHMNAVHRESKMSSVEEVRDKLINYVHSVFPIIFYSDHWLVRLKDEIRRNHSYMMLFNSVDGDLADKKRILNGLRLLTAQTCLMFLLALLYDLQGPSDDGSCPYNVTEGSCIMKKSVLDDTQAFCKWQPSSEPNMPSCTFNNSGVSFKASLYIQVVVSVFTAILMRPLSWGFDVLLAPRVDSLKEKVGEEKQLNDEVAVPSAPTAEKKQSILFSKEMDDPEMDELAEMLITLIPDDIDMVHKQAKSYFRRINNTEYDTSDAALLEGESKKPNRKSMIDKLKNSLADFAMKKKDGENEVVQKLMGELTEKIHVQRILLSGEELEVFDKQWGLDSEGNFLTNVDNIKGKVDIQTLVEKEVRLVEQSGTEDIERLRRAMDNHLGLEILHKFILDILGRDTPAALIFSGKTEEDFKKTSVRSMKLKVFVTIFIFLANALFIYYSVLRGYIKGIEWQKQYLVACIIQMVLEIYLFETIECIWINVCVPSLVHPEVQRVNHLLLDIINDLCTKVVEGKKITDTDKKIVLDAPDYLFKSTRMAKAFPKLMESIIVRTYHNHLPGEMSQKWVGEQKVFARRHLGINAPQNRDSWALTISSILTMLVLANMIAFVPFDMQKMIVRFFQPFIFGGLVLLWQKIVSSILGIIVAIIVIFAIVAAAFAHYYYHKAVEDDEDSNLGKIRPLDDDEGTFAKKDALKKSGKVIPMSGSPNKKESSLHSNGVTEDSYSVRDAALVNELEMVDRLHESKGKKVNKKSEKKTNKKDDKMPAAEKKKKVEKKRVVVEDDDDDDDDSYLLSISDGDMDDLHLDD